MPEGAAVLTSSTNRRDLLDRLRPLALRWWFFGAAAGIAIVTLVHVVYYLPRVVDDLFISLRYAENLARGRGLVYNPGERVEGFSSPLWVLLQALGFSLGAEGVTFTKALGLGSLVALQIGLYRYGRERLGLDRGLALLSSVFVGLNSYAIAWTVLGLETPGYLALLVWFAVVLHRFLFAPSRARLIAAASVALALALARPEAALLLGAIGLAEVGVPLRLARLRTALPLALAVAIGGTTLLLLRRAYFGHWVPHTYFAKQGSGIVWPHVEALFGQGAGIAETFVFVGGCAGLLAVAVVRRAAAPIAAVVACLVFVASVDDDWMPSLRHLLPVTVLAPLGWAWAAKELLRFRRRRWLAVSAAAFSIGVVLLGGAGIAAVDSRYSQREFWTHGRVWVRPKTPELWADSLFALRRVEPPHVTAMSPHWMGMLTQNFWVLEASAAPLSDSWYVGRDVGKVGYYTGVRVFDTDGLFTPAIAQDAEWRRSRAVGAALIGRAFALRPIAAEIYGEWSLAAGRRPDLLARFALFAGSPRAPVDLMAVDVVRPSPAEILRRYERSLARFPRLYYLSTLYGECVGAAMAKRVHYLRDRVRDNASPLVDAAPADAVGGAITLDGGAIESLGCRVSPSEVRAGDEIVLTCFFRALRRVRGSPWVFLHFGQGPGSVAFQGDHPALGGLFPPFAWPAGRIVRDAERVRIPPFAAAGVHRTYFGLFEGARRLRTDSTAGTDGQNRVVGPTIVVRP